MWKHTRGGKHYLVKEARDFYVDVGFAVRDQGAAVNLIQPLRVQCLLYPPDRRRRDMDNAWKVIADALTKSGVWQDDSLIRSKLIEWMEPCNGGKVVLSLAPYVENRLTS
jgi:crossover junction endodeoxyribonuclease RusA